MRKLFFQRTNTVAVAFTDSTPVKQRTDVELVEKIVDLIKNLDVSLRLRTNSVNVHYSSILSP